MRERSFEIGKLFVLTFTGITLIIFTTGFFGFKYVFKMAADKLIESRIDAAHHEAELIAHILSQKLLKGTPSDQVKNDFQESIEYMDMENGFVCMFNTEGVEICHPLPEKVGQMIDSTNSIVRTHLNDLLELNFRDILESGISKGGIRKFLNRDFSEIIYVVPVKGENWMVASHENLLQINKNLKSFKSQLALVFILIGLVLDFLIFLFVRYISLRAAEKTMRFTNSVLPASSDMGKSIPVPGNAKEESQNEYSGRLLAYKGQKLIPVNFSEIAYVYTEYKISYITCHSGEVLNCNLTLEEIHSQLDRNRFYRANRQYIISISSISKVMKYGNTNLKVEIQPPSSNDIIISKAKAADFKKWLGKG